MKEATVTSLSGRVALVTGGSSGIGLAIAARLAREGADVALVASGDPTKASAAAEQVAAKGGRATPFLADVRDAASVKSLVKDVSEQLGPIDILINSAGVWYPTPLARLSEENIDHMVDVNLKGVIRMVAAVAPTMMTRRSGKIVNLASIAGILPSSGFSLYSTAKAAVIMFTRAAALELAPYDVAINAIAPGNTATPLNETVRTSADSQARREWIARITPSNRAFSPPEEIAEVALFLVDGRVNGMHGTTISIDEGRSAGLVTK